MIIFS